MNEVTYTDLQVWEAVASEDMVIGRGNPSGGPGGITGAAGEASPAARRRDAPGHPQ